MSDQTVFDLAAAGSQADLTSFLDANPNATKETDTDKWTPLHHAAKHGRLDAVKALVDRGADPQATDAENRTPRDIAYFWAHLGICDYFDEKILPSSGTSKKHKFRTANYFGGSPLKRHSEKRPDAKWLSAMLTRHSTRYILFNTLQPMCAVHTTHPGDPVRLHYFQYSDVEKFISLAPAEEGKRQWLYLGCDKSDVVEEGLEGRGYVAVDISPSAKAPAKVGGEEEFIKDAESRGLKFVAARPSVFQLPTKEAAIVAEALAVLDWNLRHPFCPSCGQRSASYDGGWKRSCPKPKEGEEACLGHKGIQNFQFPRTDPVCIVCIVSQDGQRCFLGRQKRFPPKFYSCIAGFMEPAESVEDCVRREIKEETGIVAGRVIYHSTQPWPFPSSLMIGCLAVALTEKFEPEEDELEHAAWFSKEEILEALGSSHKNDWALAHKVETKQDFVLGPGYAIAVQILKAWASGEVDVNTE
ncbi:hypothetical protein M427DRAFT_52047 [Gonapodya prolifera JEL478]|uniref:NAD-capped RNA hydrolase NUDT12 n=1 Tax=Gonapodya prolifera (strain JEL478) TaxID=1344416 RepID=A0A139AV93_GONPJ|nr:hypothetical protein M427DRAFT_52047 [Gonapodya prolifera JEL478]|eukprot:KXS20405.1 hypothetical protein M427DRAFT_52047 [Gonapodya prolifera JEL478]